MSTTQTAPSHTLFMLEGFYKDLYDRIDLDPEAQLTDDEFEMLVSVEADFHDKACRYGHVYKALMLDAAQVKGQAAAFEEEAKRLKARGKSLEGAAKGLLRRVGDAMVHLDIPKCKDPNVTVYLQKNPDKAEIADEALPQLHALDLAKMTYAADKKAVLKALKEGQALPAGVELIEGERAARVK